MKLLNLGCGTHFHNDWTNLDFVSTGENVIAHDLLKGIPFKNKSFDVVYHSHVLEHFRKEDGAAFMKECYRVLKPGGIIRVVLPNLETIVKNYIQFLDAALLGNKRAEHNYDWTLIELYDQAVRNKGGGDMLEYLKSDMPNADFVYSRIGKPKESAAPTYYSASRTKRNFLRFLNPKTYFHKISRVLMSQEDKEALELGKFRLSGEIHLHMYDRFSLARLLGNTGFRDIILTDAFSSKIFNWEKYKLDFSGTDSRKPDSLFVEAIR